MQYEQALTLYQMAEISFQTMSDERSLAMVYNNLGLVYTALNDWIEAEVNLQRSIWLYQQIDDRKASISARGNLGIAYLEQARYPQAIQTFQESLTELQTTAHDPYYEQLWQDLNKYLTQAQVRYQAQKS
jgi:tetratricopeptide (TPR) repeat protein